MNKSGMSSKELFSEGWRESSMLRALATLIKDSDLIPRTQIAAHKHL